MKEVWPSERRPAGPVGISCVIATTFAIVIARRMTVSENHGLEIDRSST